MPRILYAILVGLVGAGIVHIAILMMLPSFSERDAWSRLSELAELYGVASVDVLPGDQPIMRSADPFFRAVACRFDLTDGLVHVEAEGSVPYWSASVYDRNGQNIYSFNDRTQNGQPLDFAVMTPAQIAGIRKDPTSSLESAVFVEADISEGMIIVRGFVPDESWTTTVQAFLSSVTCETE